MGQPYGLGEVSLLVTAVVANKEEDVPFLLSTVFQAWGGVGKMMRVFQISQIPINAAGRYNLLCSFSLQN